MIDVRPIILTWSFFVLSYFSTSRRGSGESRVGERVLGFDVRVWGSSFGDRGSSFGFRGRGRGSGFGGWVSGVGFRGWSGFEVGRGLRLVEFWGRTSLGSVSRF